MHAADATIAKIKYAIGTLIKNDGAEATRSLVNINQLIQNFEDQLKTMPSELLRVIALTRSNDVVGQLSVLLIQKGEAEVSKAETIVDTRVVTPAEFPMTATTPKAALLTGLFWGLSAGIRLVLARRAVSGRVHEPLKLRQEPGLAEWPVTTQRPHSKRRRCSGF